MFKTSKQELLVQFGFSRDPFKKTLIASGDYKRICQVVGMAIGDQAMVSIVGERGIGKSIAVKAALGGSAETSIVYPYSNDTHKVLISDIEQAIILDLSNEKPKRGREIRARQLRRILGGASTRKDVVLVLEEAHLLHSMTLRSLKRIREMEWMGETGLLSVILICQSDPLSKPGVSEVRLRSDSIQMKGLSQKEIVAFITKSVGKVFDQEVIETLSRVSGSHNYEDLKIMLFQLMENALFEGRRRVELRDIDSVFSDVNLAEIYQLLNISLPVTKMKDQVQEDMTKEDQQLSNFLKHYKEEDSGPQQKVANR